MVIVYRRASPVGVMPTANPPREETFATWEEAWNAVLKDRSSILSIAEPDKSYSGSEIDDEIERQRAFRAAHPTQ
jgi:hypothetical protein